MRIAVIGTGGIGGPYGAALTKAGADVTFVARGTHLAAMRENGLRVEGDRGETHIRPAQATDDIASIGTVDFVLSCVKLWDVEEGAEQIRPIVGPHTAVIPLQNGIDAAERMIRILGDKPVMGGMAFVTGTIVAPGVVRQTGTYQQMTFGELDGRVSERAERLRDAFAHAEIPVELSKTIRRALWEKYLLICAVGGTTAVTRETIGVVRDTPATWRLFRTIVEEVTALARASGVDLANDAVEQIVKFAETIPPGNRASLAQDVLQGRRLELEALHGHAARLGERLGVPTPAIFAVYAALAPHAAGRRG